MSDARCPLMDPKIVRSLRESLDRDNPGWTEAEVACRRCREYHTVTRDPGQMPMLRPGSGGRPRADRGRDRRSPPIPANAGPDWCRWHRTSSPSVHHPCAHCGSRRLHVHQDMLGPVRSGRAGQGYLVERCPACHQSNAVQPLYTGRGVRASRIDDSGPVVQMTLRGLG